MSPVSLHRTATLALGIMLGHAFKHHSQVHHTSLLSGTIWVNARTAEHWAPSALKKSPALGLVSMHLNQTGCSASRKLLTNPSRASDGGWCLKLQKE